MASYTKNLSSYFTGIPSASSWFEVYAAFSTFMMLLRTVINDMVPHQVRSFITSKLGSFFAKFQAGNEVSLKIDRNWDRSSGTNRNELYYAANDYLPTRINRTYKALKVGKLEDHKNLVLAVDGNQEVVDEFEGTKFTWMPQERTEKDSPDSSRPKYTFILSFNEKHREKVMDRYIPHVLRTCEAMKVEQKIVKINSWSDDYWDESDLSHPATFDTLALNPELKQAIIDDLDRFLRRKELYKKVGKPWKRGYFLYGPPGTGKSSLIAAIANYLKFDVYDLELNSVYSNSDLMRAIRETSYRSIIVIEDIDCNKELQRRSTTENPGSESDKEGFKVKRFTLSGLLNYMDGLWSSCGEERIVVFTTNHKERIDPALLRPGRMDMHINLSFLKGKAFRILASNYLGIEGDHPLFEQIDGLLEKTEVTPAVVAEHLMRNEDPDVSLEAIVKFLKEMDMDNQVELQLTNTQLSSIGD